MPTGQSSKSLSLLGPLLVLILALASPASAAPATTFDIYSHDFDIGSPVWVNITGPGGMAISIRITDTSGTIISGRDTSLDAAGNYSFEWKPSQEGSYNVTVTWATGFSVTKSVLIQDKVTSREIGEVYQALFGMERRLREAQAEIQKWASVAVGVSIVSAILAAAVLNYARNAVPRPKTEFERFLEEDVRARLPERRKKE